jgi:hypothetical protein
MAARRKIQHGEGGAAAARGRGGCREGERAAEATLDRPLQLCRNADHAVFISCRNQTLVILYDAFTESPTGNP